MTETRRLHGPGDMPYRLGTYDDFYAAMFHGLLARSVSAPLDPRLVDASLALLDGWATLADILTFYQEQIANEGFLATATDPFSMVQLARLVDVRPAPGVAARVHLAYLLDPTIDPTTNSIVPAGSRVQSVPSPGDIVRTFETLADLTARAGWNTLPVRRMGAALEAGATDVYLDGATPTPTPSDVVLLPSQEAPPQACQVISATPDPASGRCRVEMDAALVNPAAADSYGIDAETAVLLTHRAALFGATALPQPVITKGQVTGYEDRPRTDLVRWGFTMTIAPKGLSVSAFVSGIPGPNAAAPQLAAGPGPIGPPLVVGDTSVTFTAGLDPAGATLYPLTVTFAAPRALTVAVGPSRAGTQVDVTVDGKHDSFEVAVGSTCRRLVGDQQVRVGYAPRTRTERTPVGTPGAEVLMVETTRPSSTLLLDGVHPEVGIGSWIAIVQGDGLRVTARSVTSNDTVGISGFGLPQRVSRLTLDRPWGPSPDADLSGVRGTTIYLESARRPLSGRPMADPITGEVLELAGDHSGLAPGRLLAVSGTTEEGTTAGEVVAVAAVTIPTEGALSLTRVSLAPPLAHTYRRDQTVVHGNVVAATQGTTWDEVLGSGDPTTASQSFALRHFPLTYRPTTADAAPDIDVLIDDVHWTQVVDLSIVDAAAQAYLVVLDETGGATVRFGDGLHGARLPAGAENVRAVYRSGSGAGGNVAAGQLTQLQSRPPGVIAVINPVAASGGVDAEAANAVRTRATAGLGSLGRVVALPDYEDLAQSRPGIGKAAAQLLRVQGTGTIVVTVAAPTADPPHRQSTLIRSLQDDLTSSSADNARPVAVLPRRLSYLRLGARLKHDPTAVWERVKADALAALTGRYGYESRELGEGVFLADIVDTLMQVPGIDYVTIDHLSTIDEAAPIPGPPLPKDPVPNLIPGSLAIVTAQGPQAAALLVLEPSRPETVQLDPLA